MNKSKNNKPVEFTQLREIMKQKEIRFWQVSNATGISIGMLNHLSRGIVIKINDAKKRSALIDFIKENR